MSDDWQLIATAPKEWLAADSKRAIILRRGDRVTAGSWAEAPRAGWISWDGGFSRREPPTHWMPLPDPPA